MSLSLTGVPSSVLKLGKHRPHRPVGCNNSGDGGVETGAKDFYYLQSWWTLQLCECPKCILIPHRECTICIQSCLLWSEAFQTLLSMASSTTWRWPVKLLHRCCPLYLLMIVFNLSFQSLLASRPLSPWIHSALHFLTNVFSDCMAEC